MAHPFFSIRIAGLDDAPRPGKTAKYDENGETNTGPTGCTAAGRLCYVDRRLVAQALGDVSPHHIWRVLRRHGIHLQRRHSWCVSTDPEFTQKAADIVGLYLDSPG